MLIHVHDDFCEGLFFGLCSGFAREWGIYHDDDENGKGGNTHAQQFRICQHAFFQTRCQKIHMILHEFIHRSLDTLSSFSIKHFFLIFIFILILTTLGKSPHKRPPIRFNDLARTEIQELLHKTQHSTSQTPGSPLPGFDSAGNGWGRSGCGVVGPGRRFDVFGPGIREESLEVVER